jgi:ABC-type nitrate/sulfonate/bicarbonate transport system permease component
VKEGGIKYIIASWSGVLVLLLAWQLATQFHLVKPDVFPSPADVVNSVEENLTLGRLLEHIGASLLRIALGFGLGASVGVIIGIVSGWNRRFGVLMSAPLDLLRPVPPLAWIPIAIIWFGIGLESKVFIIFLAAFFPIYTSAYKGVVNLDIEVIRAGQLLGARGLRLLFRVMLPMTLPDIATGMRLGWSYSFGAMVAAEIIAANSGLGYLVMHGRELGSIGIVMFGILVIGALNLITDYFIQDVIIRRQLHWHYGE